MYIRLGFAYKKGIEIDSEKLHSSWRQRLLGEHVTDEARLAMLFLAGIFKATFSVCIC